MYMYTYTHVLILIPNYYIVHVLEYICTCTCTRTHSRQLLRSYMLDNLQVLPCPLEIWIKLMSRS